MVKAMVTVSQNSLTLLRIQPSTCSRKVYWEWKRLGRAGWREKKEIRQKGERLPCYLCYNTNHFVCTK